MELTAYILLATGGLIWLIGGTMVFRRVTKRLGLRWPTLPPWSKITSREKWALAGFMACAAAGYLGFVILKSA
jgi:hypothetical protein